MNFLGEIGALHEIDEMTGENGYCQSLIISIGTMWLSVFFLITGIPSNLR